MPSWGVMPIPGLHRAGGTVPSCYLLYGLAARIGIGNQRHSDMDGRSQHWLRNECDRSVHQSYALAHAGETQAPAVQRCLQVETFARISDVQVNLTGDFQKLHVHPSGTAVFDGVLQSLLQNPKQADTEFAWQRARHVASEIDLQFLALAEFLAPAFNACDETQILHF